MFDALWSTKHYNRDPRLLSTSTQEKNITLKISTISVLSSQTRCTSYCIHLNIGQKVFANHCILFLLCFTQHHNFFGTGVVQTRCLAVKNKTYYTEIRVTFGVFHKLLFWQHISGLQYCIYSKINCWQDGTDRDDKSSLANIKTLRMHQKERWKEKGSPEMHCEEDIMSTLSGKH